jgi:hypothetical protein
MRSLSSLKDLSSLSQIESLSSLSNFDRFCAIICEYVYDTTSFIIRKRTNKSKNNQTFEFYLRSYVNYQQNDWIKWLNIAEYAYNNSLNSVLKQTSFQMMFDSEVKFENVIQKDLKIDVFAARDRVVQLSKMKRICETRWKQALDKAKRNYNKKKTSIEFKINDKVFLNAKNIISIRSFKKLNYKLLNLKIDVLRGLILLRPQGPISSMWVT